MVALASEAIPVTGFAFQTTEAGNEARRADLDAELIRRAQYYAILYTGTLKEQAEAQAADRILCASSFVHWVSNWGWMRPRAAEADHLHDLPVVLWPAQAEMVAWLQATYEEAVKGQRTLACLIPKGRELGATWIVLLLLYWEWRFCKRNSLLGSRTGDQVAQKGNPDALLSRVGYILEKQPRHLRPKFHYPTNLIQDLDSSAAIRGERTTKGFGRGGGMDYAYIDEFAEVENNVADGMWMSIDRAARLVIVTYNPGPTSHKSYELFRSLPPDQVRVLDWRTDPYRPPDFPERQLMERGGMLTAEEVDQQHRVKHGALVRSGGIWQLPVKSAHHTGLTYQEDELPEGLRSRSLLLGAWDFGTGASFLVNLQGLVIFEDGPNVPVQLWVDWGEKWQRAEGIAAGYAVMAELQASYVGCSSIQVGDPSGNAPGVRKETFIGDIRSTGCNLRALPEAVNGLDAKDDLIRKTKALMDSGRLRVHSRLDWLMEHMRMWKWDVPKGMRPEEVNRAKVSPRKDQHSHACETVLYMVFELIKQQAIERQRRYDLAHPEERQYLMEDETADGMLFGTGSRGSVGALVSKFRAGG